MARNRHGSSSAVPQTIMGLQTNSTRDTRGESAKSGNLYATPATCEEA
jgi:hypothetical protein